MGILDQILGGIGAGAGARRPTMGGAVAAGVVLALLVNGVRIYQAHQVAAAAMPAGVSPAEP